MFARLRSLLRFLFFWRISDTKQDEATENPPDCIIMLAFGQKKSPIGLGAGLYTSEIVPGPANEAIARRMEGSNRKTTYPNGLPPILAQWELAETGTFRGPLYVTRLNSLQMLGARGAHHNTREILEEAIVIMDYKGWSTAVIVAHPWHLRRCIWTAEKLGIVVVHDQLLTQELNAYANIWNKNVAVPPKQLQTTSLKRWLWYEFRARIYFWLEGWI